MRPSQLTSPVSLRGASSPQPPHTRRRPRPALTNVPAPGPRPRPQKLCPSHRPLGVPGQCLSLGPRGAYLASRATPSSCPAEVLRDSQPPSSSTRCATSSLPPRSSAALSASTAELWGHAALHGAPGPCASSSPRAVPPTPASCPDEEQALSLPSSVPGTARRLWATQCLVGSEDGSLPCSWARLPPKPVPAMCTATATQETPTTSQGGPRAGPSLPPGVHLATMGMKENPAPRTQGVQELGSCQEGSSSVHLGDGRCGPCLVAHPEPSGRGQSPGPSWSSVSAPLTRATPQLRGKHSGRGLGRAAWALHPAEPSSTACGSPPLTDLCPARG